MSDLIDTTEMYLRTIYELIEDGVVPMRARIAEQLDHSGPTVSQTIARMERDGLVVVSGDRHLELTAEGRAIAVRVMRKHRLAERLLTDVIGLELEYVHEEACRWEHVMSERVERRLLDMLGTPRSSPYGNPIPGLGELGAADVSGGAEPGISLVVAADSGMDSGTISRIGEHPQADAGVLKALMEARLIPGATIEVEHTSDGYVVRSGGAEITLDAYTARHVFVHSIVTNR